MQKKAKLCSLFLVLLLALPLAGCVKDKRFDYSELNIRLQKADPAFAFDETSMFFAENVYYCYLSLSDEEDTLLTLKQDENCLLERITLTRAAPFGGQDDAAFRAYALALAEVFIPEAELARLETETGLSDPAALREKTLRTFTQGFYRAALFGTDKSVSFLLEYG